MSKLHKITNYEKFMLESNAIEGETGLNPGDRKAFNLSITRDIKSMEDILLIHKTLTEHLNVDWSGKWRDCNVSVGDYVAPHYNTVPNIMKFYLELLPRLGSWKAHNDFEKIHPFQDFNGRVGRLIWLNKVLKEGYNFGTPFLQKYYYQTLSILGHYK